MSALRQHLTLAQGTALMLNIVLGAGVLILPGLAVREAGDLALVSWIVCGLAALPLLAIFVILGRRYPNAGGISHVAGRAFGRPAYIVGSLLFLGAVVFGLPSIALTGGYYAASLTNASPHALAALLLLGAAGLNLLSAERASRLTGGISALLVVLLIAVAALAVLGGGERASTPVLALPQMSDLNVVLAPFMMIFFAFTGWEVAANLSEEFRRPSRDFPLAMLASFLLACGLYFALAYAAQTNDLAGAYEAPFARIFADRYGPIGMGALSIVAVVLIFANLAAAVWAVSRLVFSLSREGVLPVVLQHTRSGMPHVAVYCTVVTFFLVIIAEMGGFLRIDQMLALAGQNFLLLYGVAAAALVVLSHKLGERLLALVGGLLVALLLAVSGASLLYPFLLGLTGIGIWRWQRHTVVPTAPSVPGA